MRLLIDSHVLVWLLYEPERFGPELVHRIETADAVYVSPVSLWELATKHAAGELAYTPEELAAGCEALSLSVLPLLPPHVLAFAGLDLPKCDPFDRMLLAQARAEGCVPVTADAKLIAAARQAGQKVIMVC